MSNTMQLFLDGALGQYLPRDFARSIKRDAITGVSNDKLDYLAKGPGGVLDEDKTLSDGETERGEFYWDVWQDVLDRATIIDGEQKFFLYQDGDLWRVPEGWQWNDDAETFRPPADYVLPAHWASYLFNGDDSGLDERGEREKIHEWLQREGNPEVVDCSEPYYSRRNDATNTAGDVCDYWTI